MGMIANYQSTTDTELEKFMCLDDVEEAQENENLEICDIDKMWDALHFLLTGKSASGEYFSGERCRGRFYLFLLWTLGATMGVFLSADLYTTFVFFEIMSFTSYVWVAQEENGPALRAAATYLAVAVAGGLVMLMGIFLLDRKSVV